MAVLGIDTSNYRTSICLVNDHCRVLYEKNPLLKVEQGKLGLQQSVAVFEHMKIWPEMIKDWDGTEKIEAVGVSTKPRPVADSYMPVFKVGESFAETIAHFLSVPLYRTTHQEGHIAAGEHSLSTPLTSRSFLAVHISGGTSEVLKCRRTKAGYRIERLGGTLDLHAGQYIDRVGVQLGLPFPAGPHLEDLALQTDKEIPVIPSYSKNIDFSFSGPATAALRLITQKQYTASQIARAVEKNIAKTLKKSLATAMRRTGNKDILLVGGVASNQYITNFLRHQLEHPALGGKIYISSTQYATDNAFGVACLAQNALKHK